MRSSDFNWNKKLGEILKMPVRQNLLFPFQNLNQEANCYKNFCVYFRSRKFPAWWLFEKEEWVFNIFKLLKWRLFFFQLQNLLKRILPHIKDQTIRWDIWNAIFISLTVFKRDKLEEIEMSLMALYYEFAVQLQDAEFNDLLKFTNNMMLSDKLMSYVNGCKVIFSLF